MFHRKVTCEGTGFKARPQESAAGGGDYANDTLHSLQAHSARVATGFAIGMRFNHQALRVSLSRSAPRRSAMSRRS
jgi:histidyl-tRNA synthetase